MSRNEKKSRARGLPSKILLDRREAITGSYPSIARNAADNRTGVYGVRFNDERTIVFENTDDYVIAGGYKSGSNQLPDELKSEYSTTTELKTTGNVQKGIVDEFIEPKHYEQQELKPFHDEANSAVDGLSRKSDFYLTGSRVQDIGFGFTNPLWSKTKIEIDLTPNKDHSFFIDNLTASNGGCYPMAYWNKSLGVWEGIGPGNAWHTYASGTTYQTLRNLLEDQTIGFGGSLTDRLFVVGDNWNSASYSRAAPISNFGFPLHNKFEATSSNCIKMSDYISKPFLLEKVVLWFSGTLNLRGKPFTYVSTPYSVLTFFILNQRQFSNLGYSQTMTTISGSEMTYSLSKQTVSQSNANSQRDLVTWLQMSRKIENGEIAYETPISKEAKNVKAGFDKEYVYNPITETLHFSHQMSVSGTAKSPIQYDKSDIMSIDSISTAFSDTSTGIGFYQAWKKPGRNLNNVFDKNFKNAYLQPQKFRQINDSILANSVTINKSYNIVNPYYLSPEDNLVFGFQLPIPQTASNGLNGLFNNNTGPELSFSSKGTHKVILYGSEIQNGVEVHDTQNQLLTNNVIHETIEGDE